MILAGGPDKGSHPSNSSPPLLRLRNPLPTPRFLYLQLGSPLARIHVPLPRQFRPPHCLPLLLRRFRPSPHFPLLLRQFRPPHHLPLLPQRSKLSHVW